MTELKIALFRRAVVVVVVMVMVILGINGAKFTEEQTAAASHFISNLQGNCAYVRDESPPME